MDNYEDITSLTMAVQILSRSCDKIIRSDPKASSYISESNLGALKCILNLLKRGNLTLSQVDLIRDEFRKPFEAFKSFAKFGSDKEQLLMDVAIRQSMGEFCPKDDLLLRYHEREVESLGMPLLGCHCSGREYYSVGPVVDYEPIDIREAWGIHVDEKDVYLLAPGNISFFKAPEEHLTKTECTNLPFKPISFSEWKDNVANNHTIVSSRRYGGNLVFTVLSLSPHGRMTAARLCPRDKGPAIYLLLDDVSRISCKHSFGKFSTEFSFSSQNYMLDGCMDRPDVFVKKWDLPSRFERINYNVDGSIFSIFLCINSGKVEAGESVPIDIRRELEERYEASPETLKPLLWDSYAPNA